MSTRAPGPPTVDDARGRGGPHADRSTAPSLLPNPDDSIPGDSFIPGDQFIPGDGFNPGDTFPPPDDWVLNGTIDGLFSGPDGRAPTPAAFAANDDPSMLVIAVPTDRLYAQWGATKTAGLIAQFHAPQGTARAAPRGLVRPGCLGSIPRGPPGALDGGP